MNKSFHYHCIRVLSEKAGFPADEAQTIAYASQYTDDSCEFGPIKIRGIPADLDYPRWDSAKERFDPICTAHSASSWAAKAWKWAKFYLKTDVQRKILMPFHFLPPEPADKEQQNGFDFVTRENSALSKSLLDEALRSLQQAATAARTLALIKLGIALHTYADTWAHSGFSGRHSSRENDIKSIKTRQQNGFKCVNPLEFAVSYAAPDVGHAEAGSFPDLPGLCWIARYANKKGSLGKDNLTAFIQAAQEIYIVLSRNAPAKAMKWTALSAPIEACFKNSGAWENTFREIKFDYHRFTWRAAALKGDTVDWEDFGDESDFKKLNFSYTGKDRRWLLFHKAAHEQRRFLEKKIPQAWLTQ